MIILFGPFYRGKTGICYNESGPLASPLSTRWACSLQGYLCHTLPILFGSIYSVSQKKLCKWKAPFLTIVKYCGDIFTPQYRSQYQLLNAICSVLFAYFNSEMCSINCERVKSQLCHFYYKQHISDFTSLLSTTYLQIKTAKLNKTNGTWKLILCPWSWC